MKVIARDLHCTAVRITACDVERLTVAAEDAAAECLEVWFSSQPCELDTNEPLHSFNSAG